MLCDREMTTCVAIRRLRHISSNFLRCALLAPNMPGTFRRGGVLGVRRATGKDSRMKYHGTASAFSIAPYKVSRLFCPHCQDLIIAATKSQHVSANEVCHWWACETCGYEFRTTVRWQPSSAQSFSAADEAVPQALRSQSDPCRDGFSPGR